MLIISKKRVKEILCFTIVVSGLIMYYSGIIATICRGIILLAAIPLLYLVLKSSKKEKKYLGILVVSIIIGFINYIVIGQISVARIIVVSIGYYAVGLYLGVEKKLDLHKAWRMLYVVGVIWVVYRYVNYGAHTFPTYNRNHISTILLVLLLLQTYSYESNNITVPIYYYVIAFVCCVAAIGRGGIIASGFMLAMIFLKRALGLGTNEKLTKKRTIGFIAVLTIAVLLIPIIVSNIESIESRFFSRFVSTDNTVINSNYKRQVMLLDYLDLMKNSKNLILGINTQYGVIRYADLLGGNIHNAFLNAHADFGIMGLVLSVYGTIFGVYRIWKYQYCESAIVIASFFIRSLTDDVWRNSFGGIVIWLAIIFALEERKKKKTKHKNSITYFALSNKAKPSIEFYPFNPYRIK